MFARRFAQVASLLGVASSLAGSLGGCQADVVFVVVVVVFG